MSLYKASKVMSLYKSNPSYANLASSDGTSKQKHISLHCLLSFCEIPCTTRDPCTHELKIELEENYVWQ